MSAFERKYDYVIVGAGTAGAVLAHRLSEGGSASVLVIEAGAMDYSSTLLMPAAFEQAQQGDRFSWNFYSEAEPYLDDRSLHCPRGRVLGGSSAINDMVHIRAHARDFTGWAADFSLDEWQPRHVLGYFRKAEDFDQGESAYHGSGGPMHITTGEGHNPLYHAFIGASREAGHAYTQDMNGARQEGFGPLFRITRAGQRWSTASAYLRGGVMQRHNLTVLTHAHARKVLMEGQKAVGVEFDRFGTRQRVQAQHEVILAAGAINSPKLLMLSGIGPREQLRSHGISTVHHNPHVGQNLQDALQINIAYACNRAVALDPHPGKLAQARMKLEWLLSRRGPGATNHFETGGLVRSQKGLAYPDLQCRFLPMASAEQDYDQAGRDGFQVQVRLMRPESRGGLELASAFYQAPPRLRFNHLAAESDRQALRQAVYLMRDIIAQQPLDSYRGSEQGPGESAQTDQAIDAWIRRDAVAAAQPVGTCAMGEHDQAVVDGRGRVHGLEGLRVIDASIMPRMTLGTAETMATMMAEKMADAIRGCDPVIEEGGWHTGSNAQ